MKNPDMLADKLLKRCLVLDKTNHLPLYVQLKEQLKTSIIDGVLPLGAPLPGIRRLAETLGVNQNTVLRAMRELQAEGYVLLVQGRGAFVQSVPPVPLPVDRESFDRLVTAFVSDALSMGVRLEEIVSTVIGRGLQQAAAGVRADVRCIFVEANWPTAQRYTSDLTHHLKVHFEPLLLQDLERNFQSAAHLLEQADLVVTPVVHRPEVEAVLGANLQRHIPLYTIAMEQMVETALQLGQLPETSVVGVICMSDEDARVMERAITKALPHRPPSILKGSLENMESLRPVLETASVVVMTELVKQNAAHLVPPQTRIISFRNRVDEAGLEFLRQVIANIRHSKLFPSQK
jgi:GntR family transcriptional regulator